MGCCMLKRYLFAVTCLFLGFIGLESSSYLPNVLHYGSFWVGGVQCLILDSSLISDPSRSESLYQKQYNWFEEQLHFTVNGRAPCHRLVFLHHPWYINTLSDSDEYGVIPRVTHIPFLDMIANADVAACFFGHVHKNIYTNYKGVQMIISATTAVPSVSDLRVLKVYQDHIQHVYYKMNSVPKEISL